MPVYHRGRLPRLHTPQIREILAHLQAVPAGGGLILLVRDLAGGGAGVLQHLATASPGWAVSRTRAVPWWRDGGNEGGDRTGGGSAGSAPAPLPGLPELCHRALEETSSDVLLLVEDIHLADARSLRMLRTGTLRNDRVNRLVVIGSTGADGAPGRDGAVAAAVGDVEIPLPPLTVTDTAAVVESLAGEVPPPAVVEDLHTMSAGRLDLLRELLVTAGTAAHGDPPAVTPDSWVASLRRAMRASTTATGTVPAGTTTDPASCGGVPDGLENLLQAVAVAGGATASPAPVPVITALVGGTTAATAAVMSGLLRTVPSSDGPRVAFRDPRHRAAALDLTPPSRLADLHARVAGVITDPPQILWHRLQAAQWGAVGEDSMTVLDEMTSVAAAHRARGDWRTTAQFLHQVLAATPAPAPAELRSGTVEALARSGDLPRARLWTRSGPRQPTDPTERATGSFLAMHAGTRRRAYSLIDGGSASPAVELQRAMLALADWDPRRMLDAAATAGRLATSRHHDGPTASGTASTGGPSGDTAADAALLAAVAAVINGGATSLPAPPSPGATTGTHRELHRMFSGWLSLVADDPLTARDTLGSRPSPTDPGWSPTLGIWQDAWLARTHYVLGEFENARRAVERGLSAGEAHGSVLLSPVLLWTGAQVAAFQGDRSSSLQYISRLTEDPESFMLQRVPAAMSRMIVTANSTDLVAALRAGESLAATVAERDTQQPGFWPWEDVYAQCLVRAGRISVADRVVTGAEERAENSGLVSLAAKLRVPRGGIRLRRGDVDGGLRSFEEALEMIAPTPMRVYHSRILLEYGQVLRRLGRRRRAEEIFCLAEEVFESMGAPAMVERCRRERRAGGVGGSPGSRSGRGPNGSPAGGLTPQEEQIAVMAADGTTNRDIARELSLSTKTVEHHLTNTYRKLGIGGRTELSAALHRG